MNRTTPEGAVKSAVIDLLNAERIWWQRNQSAVQIIPAQNGQKRRFIKSGRVGVADILALPIIPARCQECGCSRVCGHESAIFSSIIRVPQPLWLEIKAPRGGVQSDAQKAFQAEVTAQGHAYLLVNDVVILQAWLKENR